MTAQLGYQAFGVSTAVTAGSHTGPCLGALDSQRRSTFQWRCTEKTVQRQRLSLLAKQPWSGSRSLCALPKNVTARTTAKLKGTNPKAS
jgi:hypothetical protein